MKKNIGTTDKVIRLILGILVGVLGIIFQTWWGLIGVVLIGTALINWCPLYLPFRISTAKK
jgi:type IV secretory pathway TrbD component